MKTTFTLYYLSIYKGNLTDQEALEQLAEYGPFFHILRPYLIFTDTHILIYDLEDAEDRQDMLSDHPDIAPGIIEAYKNELIDQDDDT
jgi:hypothetical protein